MSTNARSFYERSKEPYGEEEIEQIKSEYNNDQLSIIEIGNIHKRTPGSISFQLKKQKIIEKNTDARGYNDYRNSSLYKEIVEGNTKKEKSNQTNNNDKNEPKLSKKQIQIEMLKDIQEMKILMKRIIAHLNIPDVD